MNHLVARYRLFLCELDFHSLRKLAVAIGGWCRNTSRKRILDRLRAYDPSDRNKN